MRVMSPDPSSAGNLDRMDRCWYGTSALSVQTQRDLPSHVYRCKCALSSTMEESPRAIGFRSKALGLKVGPCTWKRSLTLRLEHTFAHCGSRPPLVLDAEWPAPS